MRVPNVRAAVRQDLSHGAPGWCVQVFADAALITDDFVEDWAGAIRLANADVAAVRTTQAKAALARYSRVGKMRRHRRRTLITAMRSDGTFESTIMVCILKAYDFLPQELGLELRWEDKPVDEVALFAAELAPALGNPLVQAALADPELKRSPPDWRCRLFPEGMADAYGIAIHDSRIENHDG